LNELFISEVITRKHGSRMTGELSKEGEGATKDCIIKQMSAVGTLGVLESHSEHMEIPLLGDERAGIVIYQFLSVIDSYFLGITCLPFLICPVYC
jgi:hypothetical protein